MTIPLYSQIFLRLTGTKELSITKTSPSHLLRFLGPDVADKSTTIRSVLNFLKPARGSITVYRLDSVKQNVEIKHKVGYRAGEIALYESLLAKAFSNT